MIVSLKRKIAVNCIEIIGEIIFEEERNAYKQILSKQLINENSIQEYFQQYPPEIKPIILKRVLNYLGEEGFIDRDGQITVKGRKTVDTGLIPIHEKGKYQLWVIDDALLGQRIIHFEREEGDFNRQTVSSGMPYTQLINRSYRDYLAQIEFLFSNFDGRDPKSIPYKSERRYDSTLDLTWTIEYDEVNNKITQNSIIFVGNVKDSKGFQKISPITQQSTFNKIHQMMGVILGDSWDPKICAQMLEFSRIPGDSFTSFKTLISMKNLIILEFGGFQDVTLSDLSIMPLDLPTAISWLKINLANLCRGNYVPREQIQTYIATYLNRRELEYYKTQVTLDPEEFAHELKDQNKNEEYWHLQTCLDLAL